jgi:hypothetical protein
MEIPKKCTTLVFSDIFEFCVKNHNMIPIGVYKRHLDDNGFVVGSGQNESGSAGGGNSREDRNNRKPYVWLHPPRDVELSIHDELFVLFDKHPKDNLSAGDGMKGGRMNMEGGGQISGDKLLKNEEKKV